jgi:hypothetical protein
MGTTRETVIEVELSLTEGQEYAFRQSSTMGGGALSQISDGGTMRIVFHDDVGTSGEGTFVKFAMKGGYEVTFRRLPRNRFEMVTEIVGRPGVSTLRQEHALADGETKTFTDPYGNDGRIRRYPQSEFKLFSRAS